MIVTGLSVQVAIGVVGAVLMGLENAAPVGAVDSYGPLPAAVVLEVNWQGVGALPVCPVLVTAEVGGTGSIPDTKPLDCACGGFDGFTRIALSLAPPPSFGGLSAVPVTEFDLLQTDLRLWNESLAGRLNFAARKAKARGDMAEYQRLYDGYCEAIEKGVDRRVLLGKKKTGRR